MPTQSRSSEAPFRLAIIGSGPAGFYTAHRVMKILPHAMIDMYESLPVPFGLVRYGVAPDHPEVKNCKDRFEEIASSSGFRFLGNISVGKPSTSSLQCTVGLRPLMRHYDSVLLAYGASEDKKLGLPGEMALRGIYSARQFVGWYNGLPETSKLDPDVSSAEDAVIIGQGNVALDVARILLQDIDTLRKTDIAEHALERLSLNKIKRVYIVGRRGPVQGAFTIKEIRELMHLPGVAFHPIDKRLIPSDFTSLPRASKRLLQVILNGSADADGSVATKSWSLDSCLSPTRFLENKTCPSVVAHTEFDVMKLVNPFELSSRSTATGRKAFLPSQVVFRSVGYKSTALPEFSLVGIHFDEARGTVTNDGIGRVTRSLHSEGTTCPRNMPGLYCAGWVKNGPTGVIASTMQDAFITGEAIARDWISGAEFLQSKSRATPQGWDGVSSETGLDAGLVTSWEDWLRIDQAERLNGRKRGKEREKFTNVADMIDVIRR